MSFEDNSKRPVVRRNRGTLVAAKLPMDVGSSLTLISSRNDVEELPEDSWALLVKVEVVKLESTLRFKHSRNGIRKVPIQNRCVNFEMIVESHRTSRRGSVTLELLHKLDSKTLQKRAEVCIAVEFRSEKGPKDELECILDSVDNRKEELISSNPSSSTSLSNSLSSSSSNAPSTRKHNLRTRKPTPKKSHRHIKDEDEEDSSQDELGDESEGAEEDQEPESRKQSASSSSSSTSQTNFSYFPPPSSTTSSFHTPSSESTNNYPKQHTSSTPSSSTQTSSFSSSSSSLFSTPSVKQQPQSPLSDNSDTPVSSPGHIPNSPYLDSNPTTAPSSPYFSLPPSPLNDYFAFPQKINTNNNNFQNPADNFQYFDLYDTPMDPLFSTDDHFSFLSN